MLVQVCYRLKENGEAIHTVFDTDTNEIIGLPKDWFDVNTVIIPEYSVVNYLDHKEDKFDQMCETILLTVPSAALVIENNAQSYIVVKFDGTWLIMKNSTDETSDCLHCGPVGDGNYRNIGYRRTKMLQVRAADGVYRLTYNKATKMCHTADGVFPINIDVEELSRPDIYYKGYKDMIMSDAYAVVYINDEPKFVDLVNDELILRK